MGAQQNQSTSLFKDSNGSSISVNSAAESVQDDSGRSDKIVSDSYQPNSTDNMNAFIKTAKSTSNIFNANYIRERLFTHTFRFGTFDLSGAVGTAREYLFFTKPDLNIRATNDGTPNSYAGNALNDDLSGIPFWEDLYNHRLNIVEQLQKGSSGDPFNHLLSNMVKSNLDVPVLSADTVDTPVNTYGTSYSYRGSSESSDDNPTFSLEFRDNRYLDTYMFFKAYDEYEVLKHHGVVSPNKKYITNKILHDQFAIYKFIVADDMETILYYGKMYGVIPISLPRDTFSTPTFDDGISYSIDFKAAFYEEMRPEILADFNYLSYSLYNRQPYQINPYNPVLDKADMRPAVAAAVTKDTTSPAATASPAGYVYKLRWRGGDTI